jgi:hypothetical protein
MKSKAYILIQIKELLKTNRGLCDEEIEEWIQDNEGKTVYELLTIKKHLSETMEFPDVSCMSRYRE